jgi:predicted RND superfamily exporter protein
VWNWVLAVYFVVLVAIVTAAGALALFDPDPQRATRAYHIFKIAVGVAMLRLYELGAIG